MISSVGHVALQVNDLDGSVAHATSVLGFRKVGCRDDTVYLSHGPAQHSLEYRSGPITALDHIALQARDEAGLEEACRRLVAAGATMDDSRPLEPHTARNTRFRLAGGHLMDIFVPAPNNNEHYSYQGQPPYVPMGIRPRRVGHVNLNFADLEGARALFTSVLDFRVSDIIATPDGSPLLYFLRCNHRHHTIGVAGGADGMFHYAFEVDTVQDLVRLGDALDAAHGGLLWGPGRHGAGDNIATYHREPSGALIEYFAEMQLIEDDRWKPRTWSTDDPRLNSTWGVSQDTEALFAASIPLATREPAAVAATDRSRTGGTSLCDYGA
jgi:catechol 2,3-dioxygenase